LALNQPVRAQDDNDAILDRMDCIKFPDEPFDLDRLPFFRESSPQLLRFPPRAEGKVPKGVWGLAHHPAGGRLRFRSDTSSLALKLHYPSLHQMYNMCQIGQAGVDLYVGSDGGRAWKVVYPREETDFSPIFFHDLAAIQREFCLYLPLYQAVSIEAIGLVPGASTSKPIPHRLKKPVVFYGTSITQGGCAGRPSMSYQAILGRILGLDHVNLGFSGSGKGEAEVARLTAEVESCCFVLDFALNNRTAASLDPVYGPFIDTIRKKHPATPIVCLTPPPLASEAWDTDYRRRVEGLRDVIRAAYRKHRDAGDGNIYIIEGTELIPSDKPEYYVDGVHPNDLGFNSMADGLTGPLKRILNL
jgi:lysophospholipase L1-like esterase